MSVGNSEFVPFGTEFLVNTTTMLDQDDASVAALAGGGFVVTWTDKSGIATIFDGYEVLGQVFNADGSPDGDEFQVNVATNSYQREARVSALKDGGFAVVWRDDDPASPDDNGAAVRLRLFAADGSATSGEVLVNTTTDYSQYDPEITLLAGGGFVVTWTNYNFADVANPDADVRAQLYDQNGGAVGSEILVNTTTNDHQTDPVVAALSGGGFVISWTGESGSADDMSQQAVRAQVFTASGSRVNSEFLVNTVTSAAQYESSLTGLAGGRFVATWRDESGTGVDADNSAVSAQLFNADGSKFGAEFQVNTTTASYQTEPFVTSLAGGGFIVAWMDFSGSGDDNSGTAVRGQMFDAVGTPLGGEFRINSTVGSNQYAVSMNELADGRVAIVWTDASGITGDTSGSAIRGQIFDPRVAGVDLQGTARADDLVGTGFDDTIKGANGADMLVGALGDDLLVGQGGNDILQGDAGDDVLLGGGKKDRLFGGQGDDTLEGQAGRDLLRGSVGADLLKGGAGKDRLFGGEQKDQLFGGGGGDLLHGEAGNDNLFGGGGNDRLLGGLGKDMLQGGAGADVFIFNKAAHSRVGKSDVISDFTSGDDLIDLSNMSDETMVFIGAADFSATGAEVQIVKKLNGKALVQIDVDGDGSADARIVLDGLSSAEIDALTADDFIL